jgi:hypothetical protein
MIEGWASGSKIAVLTTNPQAQYQLYLINERLGTWDDNGVWWSNSSYKRSTITQSTYYSTPTTYTNASALNYDEEQQYYAELQAQLYDDSIIIDECPTCEALIDIELSSEYCQYCEACVSCGTHILNCMCYIPHSAQPKQRELDFDNQWVRVYNKDTQAIPY